jgi:hypothetical protein
LRRFPAPSTVTTEEEPRYTRDILTTLSDVVMLENCLLLIALQAALFPVTQIPSVALHSPWRAGGFSAAVGASGHGK